MRTLIAHWRALSLAALLVVSGCATNPGHTTPRKTVAEGRTYRILLMRAAAYTMSFGRVDVPEPRKTPYESWAVAVKRWVSGLNPTDRVAIWVYDELGTTKVSDFAAPTAAAAALPVNAPKTRDVRGNRRMLFWDYVEQMLVDPDGTLIVISDGQDDRAFGAGEFVPVPASIVAPTIAAAKTKRARVIMLGYSLAEEEPLEDMADFAAKVGGVYHRVPPLAEDDAAAAVLYEALKRAVEPR